MILIDEAVWIAYPSLVLGMLLGWLLSSRREQPQVESAAALIGLREWLMVLGISVLAFALRIDGITFGFPHNFHPDEIPKLNAIERMRGAGDLNPRYFLHPSLLLYSTHFAHRFGEWLGVLDASREALNLSGRLVSVVAGTLTIPTLWYLARVATGNAAVGILSALLIAVFPLHVTCSRYLKEDALVTFWMVATAASVMSVVVNPKARWRLLWAGLFAGIAASSKYTGLVFFVFVAVAPWLRSRDWRPDRRLLLPAVLGLFLTVVGFFLCSPYALLDWSTFVDDFGYESRHMRKGHMVVISAWDHYWTYQIGRSLVPGVGLFNTIVSLAAAGAALVWMFRERSRVAFLMLLALGMTYLPAEMVNAKPEPQPDRYLMVCMPWCAMLVATMLVRLSVLRRRFVGWALILVAIGAPLIRTLELTRDLRDDTRLQLARWIDENIPVGSRIAVDYLWYGPPLDAARYTVTSLHGSTILEDIRIDKLRSAGYQYVVISSFFRDRFFRQKDNLGALRDLFRKLDRSLPLVKSVEAPSGPYGFHDPGLKMYRVQ